MVNALLKAGSMVDEKDKVSMLLKYEIELCILHACINNMTRTTMPMQFETKTDKKMPK